MAELICDKCRISFDEENKTQCQNCDAPIGTFRLIEKKTGIIVHERIATLPDGGANELLENSNLSEEYKSEYYKAQFQHKEGQPKYTRDKPYLGKINLIVILFLSMCSFSMSAQKKPTIMILPSDNWCTQRYFITEYDNQGVKERISNYRQAFQEDLELSPVISKVGELMTTLGYSLKDAEMELKNISNRMAEDNMTFSKSSGAQFTESPLDVLKRKAKADIIIQIGWVVNSSSLTFTLEAFDTYTSKRIATSSGTENRTTDAIPVQLQRAVEKHISPFDKQLDIFYSKMYADGREIVLTIRTWDNWVNDLESEFGNDELLDHIQQWLATNTIKEQYNLTDATENFAQFEQVMIPLKNEKGNAMDARSFVRGLQKYLNASPFNIPSKLMMRGLGEAILVLGEK